MKFISKIRSLNKKTKVLVSLLVLGAVVAVPMVKAEYYPARPAYDYNKPCNPNDNDPHDRCGSMNGPVFNSFINTPSYGDERAFFDGRRSDMPTNTNADDIKDVNKGSKEVVLRMYVHNNANQSTNATNGVAHNAKVRVLLPTGTEQVLRARGYISANNAALVEDTVDLLGTEKFNVSYIPGSAKLLRGTSQYALSDSIVTSGAPIGHNVMNGELPGCFEYAALVELKVKVNVQENPDLQLVKEVKMKGAQDGWKKEVVTKPGDEVQWRLGTKNISNSTLTNVNLRDVLPPHLNLVPGSIRIIDANQDTVQANEPLFGGGFGMGTYPSGGIRYIIFNTTTKDDFSSCEIRVRNQAFAKSDQTPNEEKDTSDVVIKKENCQPVTPQYSCDALKLEKLGERKIRLTANASASGGATIKRYIFNFGDNTPEFTTDQNVVEHTYANDGSYVSTVDVEVEVNGETKTITSTNCQASVKFIPKDCVDNPKTPENECKPEQPCVDNPNTPMDECNPVGKLPETGPGAVIASFVGVSTFSGLAFHFIRRRFLGL